MTRYAIRQISLLSAAKFGFVIGCTVFLIPSLVIALLVKMIVALLQGWLNSLGSFLPIGGDRTVDLLQLRSFFDTINRLADWGWSLAFFVMIIAVVVGGLLYTINSIAGASIYNLVSSVSGGIVVEAEYLDGPLSQSALQINSYPLNESGYQPTVSLSNQPPPVQLSAPQEMGVPPPIYNPQAQDRHQWPQEGVVQQPQAQPTAYVPTQAAGKASLMSLHHPMRQWPLQPMVTKIGSDLTCDIQLNGLQPLHAEIHLEETRYILYDRSDGQTWVNGRPIQNRANMIKDGFKVQIGTYEFTFNS